MMRVILERLFKEKNIKELIRYGLVGLSTTIINLAVYHIFLLFFDYRIANLVALVTSKVYGYFANKKIVFCSKTHGLKAFVLEAIRFIFARGITAVIDYFGLIIAVDVMSFDKVLSKYGIQIIVIILNFFMGKYMVFNKNGEKKVDIELNRSVQQYNPGNKNKYETKNPLKRKMVMALHDKMLGYIKEIIRRKGGEDSLHILDAGCGEGFFTEKMCAKFPHASIVGCDGAQEALSIASNSVPMVRFEQANIYDMPYKDKEFDLVVCSEVLEHLEDPRSALCELDRVGKNLLVTVPHEPWFRLGNLATLHNITRLGDPIDHINHWTFGGFKKFICTNLKRNCHFDKSFPWSIMVTNLDDIG